MDPNGEQTDDDESPGGPRGRLSDVSRRALLRAGGLGGGSLLAGGIGTALWTDRIVARAEDRFPPAGAFTDADGTRVHRVVEGTGPPVVLIHGDGGSVFDWTYSAFDRVAAEYRAVAVDRPGFGYSDPPGTLGSPFAQAAVIRSALAGSDLTRPVLVGHSRGASVALAYALSFPDATAGVVDLAGAPFGHDPAPLRFRALTWPIVGPGLAETVFVPLSAGAIREGIRAAFEPEGAPPEGYLEAYVAMERRPGQLRAHAYDSVRAEAAAERLIPRYADLRCPVAVVHGTADRNVPVEQARRLHDAVPTGRLFDVEGAGHELPFHHPDVLVRAIDWVLSAGSR